MNQPAPIFWMLVVPALALVALSFVGDIAWKAYRRSVRVIADATEPLLCDCGHSFAMHEHYRNGDDCGACGSGICARWRRTADVERVQELARDLEGFDWDRYEAEIADSHRRGATS